MSDTLIELSRWQFALTAMFHFIFVPLTLGLSFLLAIMESVYVMTGKEIYKQMTQFWGKLLHIEYRLLHNVHQSMCFACWQLRDVVSMHTEVHAHIST